MKKGILLLLLFRIMVTYAQEVLYFGSANLNLEDTEEYKYIFIDSDSVWFIGKPEKDYLFLPPEIPSLGEYAIYTDTNQYYENNVRASIQFKLVLLGDIFCVNFYQKYDFESNKDGGIIETSYNNGETWQNLIYDSYIMDNIYYDYYDLYYEDDTVAAFDNQPGFTGFFSTGRVFEVCWRENGTYLDTMMLRFTFASDSIDAENEGWLLDDFGFTVMVEDPVRDNKNVPDLYIYPNPVDNQMTINAQSESIKRIEVISITGEILFIKEGIELKTIDISFLTAGLYIMRCFNVFDQSYNVKFLKL